MGLALMTGGRVQVPCGTCMRLLCHVTSTPRGVTYQVPIGRGWDTASPYGVWCPDGHGRPDLDDDLLAAKLARAVPGRPVTHVASMQPWPPGSERHAPGDVCTGQCPPKP